MTVDLIKKQRQYHAIILVKPITFQSGQIDSLESNLSVTSSPLFEA